MNVLVTGGAGFLGRHVVRALLRQSATVTVLDRATAEVDAAYASLRVDLTHPATADLRLPRYDVVIHLAGVLPPADAMALYGANVGGTANLLLALSHAPPRRIVLVSSSAVYGHPVSDGRLTESSPLRPITTYGDSALARESVARLFARYLDTNLISIRPFNLVGPGQRPTMMIPSFARQIARMELGLQEPILSTGRLDTSRDYIDVRDAAVALCCAAIAPGPLPDVMNLASGDAVRGETVVALLSSLTHTSIRLSSQVDPARVDDPLVVVGDVDRIKAALNWLPRIPLLESLRDVLDYWRTEFSDKT